MSLHENLVLADIGLFCEGMFVEAGVYYLHKSTYVLLCKGVIFTKELIEKIHEAALLQGGVYVEESSYKEFWDESVRKHEENASAESTSVETASAKEEAFHRVHLEYNQILSEIVSLLGNVTPTKGVSLSIAENISMSILEKLKDANIALLLQCVNMIYQADSYLYTHCLNVAILNGIIGKWMKLSESMIARVIKTGLLHDLGKLNISSQILDKPGKLTRGEFEIVKQHPVFSYETLKKSGELDEEVLLGVRQHHEKFNGCGYPDGIKQQEIALAARITSVSDVYDAMVSKRCYKDPSTPFDVLDLFRKNQFSDLDTQIVNIFLNNIVYLIIGTPVKLSTGETGEVIFIGKHDYCNPVVRVGSRIFSTSQEVYIVTT